MRRKGRLQNRALGCSTETYQKGSRVFLQDLPQCGPVWFLAEWSGNEQGLQHQRDKALSSGCVTLAKNLMSWSLRFLISKRGIMNPPTEGAQKGPMQWPSTQDPTGWCPATHHGSLEWPGRTAQWDKQGSLWWPKGRVGKGGKEHLYWLVGSFLANS